MSVGMRGLIARGAMVGWAVGLAYPAVVQEVGKASAVNPAATANLRTISIGSSIAHKERIKTTAEGSVRTAVDSAGTVGCEPTEKSVAGATSSSSPPKPSMGGTRSIETTLSRVVPNAAGRLEQPG